jgi:translation initiation factor 2 subunit 2
MFKDLAKKKKKKSKKETEDGEAAATPENPDEIDMSALKKKKKKKPKAEDFDAKLAEVGEDGAAGEAKETVDVDAKQDGDMIEGTGIWAHDATQPIEYELLLKRFYINLHDRHPDLTGGIAKSYKIPPPQCLREGNKKTIFANLADIAKRLHRSDEHVTQFLFAELGTTGSVDGSKRLVIRGRFQSKQIEK